jgi:hypothetical protein
MKKMRMIAAALIGGAILAVVPISLHQSPEKGLLLSVDSAYAVVGRPLTPGSVAGVHRRVHRRAYRHGYHHYHY